MHLSKKEDPSIWSIDSLSIYFSIVFFMTFLGIAWMVWDVFKSFNAMRGEEDMAVRIENMQGDALYLDELLTMSAGMAAATGDPVWEQQYRRYQRISEIPFGDDDFPEATRRYIKVGAERLRASCQKLNEMEELAFEWVHRDLLDQPQAILFSEEYNKYKRVYESTLLHLAKIERINLRLLQLRNTILHLDQVLTMSTHLAVATGDVTWEKRYMRNAPDLDLAISEAIDLAPEGSIGEGIRQTREAYLKLSGMSARIFKLIRQDRLKDANTVLFGEEYEKQEEIYARGIETFAAFLERSSEEAKQSEGRRAILEISIGIIIDLALIFSWIGILRVMKRSRGALLRSHWEITRHSEELTNLNEELEARVLERTRNLAKAKTELERNIHDREKREEERNRMEVQLRHAQKLEGIGQLAAGIAHEINTPTQYIGDNTRFLQEAFEDLFKVFEQQDRLLQAVKERKEVNGLLSEVEKAMRDADLDYLKEEIPKAIKQSIDGVHRVTKIVNAMKEFSHPGAVTKTPADLNRAIENTITVARNEWKYVAEMVTDFDPDLPSVPCVLDEFNQVILNLLVNAAHAIEDARGEDGNKMGKITVSTKVRDSWAEIRIGDTGSGIPKKIREKVFDPFFTTKEVGKGTGQGLAIAHSVVVDKHNGELSFESEEGKGTVFIIRLPFMETNKERKEVLH